ncbi:MAG: hypothetical protein ACO1NX_05210 [Chitinophagaceae bacterium]
MKHVIERPGVAHKNSFDKLQKNLSLFMILFFLIMGAASLLVLINSPA